MATNCVRNIYIKDVELACEKIHVLIVKSPNGQRRGRGRSLETMNEHEKGCTTGGRRYTKSGHHHTRAYRPGDFLLVGTDRIREGRGRR
jgi:hypothetical protein